MRVPIRQIRTRLSTLHSVEVRIGEIVEVLHRRVTHAQPVRDDLKTAIRASPAVHADEMGWRDDGLNGEIGSVSTPTIRSDESHRSRAGEIGKQVIGDHVQGVLGRDLDAGEKIHAGVLSALRGSLPA
jgi:hypothetical protein